MEPITVLVVEDESAHIELIQRAFEFNRQPVHLLTAHSLTSALLLIEKQIPAIIITDLLLPDGKGSDFLPLYKDRIPIVVMTSHGNEQIAVEAIKAGALDYIVKSALVFNEMPRLVERTLREWEHIVARHQAEEQVRRSEAHLRAFIDAAAEGLLVIDEHGEMMLVNQQLEHIFGYSRDELLGQPLEILLPETLQEIHQRHREGFAKRPRFRKMVDSMVGRRKDGTTFPIEVSLSYTILEGHLMMMALVMDITERKRLEAQALETQRIQIELVHEKELRQHRDHFFSIVSHEFRTPLSVIRTSTSLLQFHFDQLQPEMRTRQFQKIDAQVEKLNSMLTDILLLSKSELDALEFSPENVDVRQFCLQLIEDVGRIDPSHEIHMHMDLVQPTACLDRYLMEHALTNLLVNAMKYSPNEPSIALQVCLSSQELCFHVIDQGIGIPEEDQKTIWQPFQRAQNVGLIYGTGLGLAIVQQFVRVHQGSITLKSQVGVGTTMKVSLPQKGVCS
jgi:PAS domain S-box-containing protein